jgi:hypothetical protein
MSKTEIDFDSETEDQPEQLWEKILKLRDFRIKLLKILHLNPF